MVRMSEMEPESALLPRLPRLGPLGRKEQRALITRELEKADAALELARQVTANNAADVAIAHREVLEGVLKSSQGTFRALLGDLDTLGTPENPDESDPAAWDQKTERGTQKFRARQTDRIAKAMMSLVKLQKELATMPDQKQTVIVSGNKIEQNNFNAADPAADFRDFRSGRVVEAE